MIFVSLARSTFILLNLNLKYRNSIELYVDVSDEFYIVLVSGNTFRYHRTLFVLGEN